jgi:hypothetical protein
MDTTIGTGQQKVFFIELRFSGKNVPKKLSYIREIIMKNIYKTTKSQLISLWVFGGIGFLTALEQAEYSGVASFFAVLIPAFLVFYTIGWRSYNKSHAIEQGEEMWQQIFVHKKILKRTIIIVIAVITVGNGVSYVYNQYSKSLRVQEEKEEYLSSYNRYDNYLDNAKKCIQKNVEQLKDVRIISCKEEYDQAHANYIDCKRDMYWLSHNQCINWPNSNYEEVDCSEDTITKKIEQQYSTECYADVAREYEKITDYEKGTVEEYLRIHMGTKSLVGDAEMREILNLFPPEVLSNKTKERIQKIIKENGYQSVNPFDDFVPKNNI